MLINKVPVNDRGEILCLHCHGTGCEITVSQIWDSFAAHLKALHWYPDEIAAARLYVGPNDVLNGLPDPQGFEVMSPDGTVREIRRHPWKQARPCGTA